MWKMYRIWMNNLEQRTLIEKIVNRPPSFSFSFNRYTGLKNKNEKDHIQFRFPEEVKDEVDKYLNSLGDLDKELFDWKEHKNTILTAMVASKCALTFMKEFETYGRPNTLVLSEFLHFFLDDLDLSYYDEYLLHSTCSNFFQEFIGFKVKGGEKKND